MRNATLTLVALVAMFTINAKADDITFKVGSMQTSKTAGEAEVAEGGTYIVVPVTMKNTTPKEKSVGGPWSPNFKLKQGEYSFKVDGGVGWTFGNSGYFDGLAVLKPLMPQTLKVVFTVPTELTQGKFTLVLPDRTEVPLN
jgi:hypothetical protein